MRHRERFLRAMLLSLAFNSDETTQFPWAQELWTRDVDLPSRFGICMDALVVLPTRAFDLVWHGYEHIVNERLTEIGALAEELARRADDLTDDPRMRMLMPMLLEGLVPMQQEKIQNTKTQVH